MIAGVKVATAAEGGQRPGRTRRWGVDVLGSRVILRVPDLDRSRAFYEGTLGLSVYREYGAGGVTTGVVYFLGGGYLELTGGDGPLVARGVVLWLQVPDLAAEETRLTAAGVRVLAPGRRMPWGLLECRIADPDGLELFLVEVPPEHPIRRRVE
jgi:catechol 2,3-dioxygenase-like lactoylglutathione lyase family enzyme